MAQHQDGWIGGGKEKKSKRRTCDTREFDKKFSNSEHKNVIGNLFYFISFPIEKERPIERRKEKMPGEIYIYFHFYIHI